MQVSIPFLHFSQVVVDYGVVLFSLDTSSVPVSEVSCLGSLLWMSVV